MSLDTKTELEPTLVPGTFEAISVPEQSHIPSEAGKPPPSLWHNRNYMLLWSGQVVSVIGSGAVQVVYPLLILAMTHSPAAAGIAAALGAVPYIVFSLPAGALIDRWNRKRVMMYCDIGRAAVLASIPIGLALHVLTIWQIYVAVLLEGSLFVFFNIAEVAALTHVVTRTQLSNAAAQNDAAYNTANLIAPSIGTFLYQTLGQAFPFVLDAVSYVVSVISLSFIRADFQSDKTDEPLHLVRDIREGVEWLWSRPILRFMGFVIGGLNFCYAASVLILILLAKSKGASETQIGLVFSMAGVGGIAGALIAPRVQERFAFGKAYTTVVCAVALIYPLYLFAPNVWVMGVIAALGSFTLAIFNVVQLMYRLSQLPDALQGRVNSAFRLMAFGFQPLGAALGGLLLEHFGVAPAITFFSVCLFGIAAATLLNPKVRHAQVIHVHAG